MSVSGGNLAGNGESFERSNPLARCKSFEYRAKENEYYRTKGLPSDNCWLASNFKAFEMQMNPPFVHLR